MWVGVLPYIDQATIFSQYNFDTHGLNQLDVVRYAKVAAFVCPSDKPYPNGNSGPVNYVGCVGSSTNFWGGSSNGMFQRFRHTQISEVLDGTSNVVMVSEQLKGDASQTGTSDSDITRAPTAPTFTDPNFPTQSELAAAVTACNIAVMAEASLSQCGRNWYSPYPGQSLFNTAVPPNWTSRSCGFGGGFGQCADRSGLFSARSRHSGGVHAVMADGAVRFINTNIDLVTWQRVGGRDDGNSVGEI